VNRATTIVVSAVAGLLVVASLSACSPDDPEPTPTTSSTSGAPTASSSEGADPSASEGAGSITREQLQTEVFAGDIGSSTVLGSATGKVPDNHADLKARVDVTEVTAFENSTLVRFTLTSLVDGTSSIPIQAFNERTPLTDDIRDVAIVDTVGQKRFVPYVGVSQQDSDKSLCACSAAPLTMTSGTTGQLLSATFPPVDAQATTLTVSVPGFPDITDVPITRS